MKANVIKAAFAVIISANLAACGAAVDLNTTKSAELKAQYDFYADSMNRLRVDMKITPEQADEVFLALVSIGCDSKVTNVHSNYGEDGVYSVSWSGVVSKDVKMENGVVVEIRNGTNILYPLERSTKAVNDAAVDACIKLIEGLGASSTREDYEAAQSAYDALDKSLKKDIGEDVLSKLSSYSLSTLSVEELTQFAINGIHADVKSVDVLSVGQDSDGFEITYNLVGSENLTRKLTRLGMWSDCSNILKPLQTSLDIAQVNLLFTMPLVDAYGNTSFEIVMSVVIGGETLQRINFDSFNYDNIPVVVDDYYEYPNLFD